MILSLYTMHKEAQVFENMIWIGKYWPSFGFSWNEASPALLCLAVKGDNTQAYKQAEHTTLHVQKHPRHSTIEYRTQNTALQSTDFQKHKTRCYKKGHEAEYVQCSVGAHKIENTCGLHAKV